MARTRRRTNASVAERLFKETYRFDFFQAVRLLEKIALTPAGIADNPKQAMQLSLAPSVGQDILLQQEIVRFKALPAFDFPAGNIYDLNLLTTELENQASQNLRYEMRVAFMGLTGPNGVLPEHYTELLLIRIRNKDFALQDFFDLFNHRTISLFYRAWEKYHFTVAWERTRTLGYENDPATHCLRSVAGIANKSLQQRLSVNDDVLFYYAGLLAQRPRSASALQALLNDYLKLPVSVEQFQGQWLYLEPAEQTRLFDSYSLSQQHQRLGSEAIVGDRVWDIRSKFRLRIGPLDYKTFTRFMPEGDLLTKVSELTQVYVGPDFDFDVQPILRPTEIPACRLKDSEQFEPRLGWNTWLGDAVPADDAEAPLFGIEHLSN